VPLPVCHHPGLPAAAYAQQSLVSLHALLGRLSIYAGLRFRITCFNLALVIAAAVAPVRLTGVVVAARLAQALPVWMQGPGGALHHSCKSWLMARHCTDDGNIYGCGSRSSNTVTSDDGKDWLCQQMLDVVQQYFDSASTSSSSSSSAAVVAADHQLWRSNCDCLLRVMLCCGEELQQQLSCIADDVAAECEQVAHRSYLPFGMAERVMLLVAVVLSGAVTAARVAQESGTQVPALVLVAVELAQAVQGPLSRCLSQYCSCFWSTPGDLAGASTHRTAVAGSSTAAGFGLCPAAWAAAARAALAAEATAAAAELLASQLVAGQERVVSGKAAGAKGRVQAAVPHSQLLPSCYACRAAWQQQGSA